jgi:hypothetical protein
VTGEPEAKEYAWESFESMEFLNRVTGIRGLPARTYLQEFVKPCCGGKWYNSTVYLTIVSRFSNRV